MSSSLQVSLMKSTACTKRLFAGYYGVWWEYAGV